MIVYNYIFACILASNHRIFSFYLHYERQISCKKEEIHQFKKKTQSDLEICFYGLLDGNFKFEKFSLV